MIRPVLLTSLLVSSVSYAVDGYKDIYIDRERNIVIHGIVCGENFDNPSGLKPSYVFTNTDSIVKGTYFYNSPYGNYSLTFNTTDNAAVMARGLLKEGQKSKEQMLKNVCIVIKIDGLPNAITKNLTKRVLEPNDPEWDQLMTQYTFVSGKPAYGKGVFDDARKTAKFDAEDKLIFDTNQQYLVEIEQIYKQKFETISHTLPEKLTAAIQYAKQHDGFLLSKTYPPIEKPAVWTAVAKQRYEDLNRRRSQEIAWDKLIQENFDWFFSIVGKENALIATQLLPSPEPQWRKQVLEKRATVQAKFENGKALELDFIITSSKVDASVFEDMQTIKKKSHLVRNNPIASSKKPRSPIQMPTLDSIDLYSTAEKTVIFFSPFRELKQGDMYRY